MKQIHKNLLCALSLAASLLTASAEGTFGKIAFMGDNVEINGSAIGWNATDPAVVEVNPATGKFEFTARFTRQRSLWQMYTDAIGENDWGTLKQSIYTPNMFVAFSDMDPEPEDIVINDGGVDCFNIKYLSEAVGQTVPVYHDPDGGFWVGGGSSLTTDKVFSFEISADLSEMKIVSVKDAEVNNDFPEYLYLLGDATPGGWELDKATRMENLGDGIYRYVGELKAGGAVQIYGENPAVCGLDAKAYGPADPGKIDCWGLSSGLNYYETGRPSGCYYTVEFTNNYIVTVDVANNNIRILFNNLFIVGQPTNWQFIQMEDEGNRVFTYKGYFKNNEVFCFAALSGDLGWSSQVAPGVPEGSTFGLAPYSDNSLTNGSAATMKSQYDSYYIVTADLNSSALKTRTYNPNPVEKLYVACEGSYNEMAANADGTFVWFGDLNGNFSITPNTEAYPCYMPATEEVSIPSDGITNSEMVFNATAANNLNNRWSIGESGKYTVKVNPDEMTVSVQKGNTTGIEFIGADEENTSVIFYDLTGRKVQNPVKGIYIRVQGTTAQKVVI